MDMTEIFYENTDFYKKKQDNAREKSNGEAQNAGASPFWFRGTAACLVLLCVLLLAGGLVLGLMLHNVMKENDQLHTERDHLQRKVSDLDNALQQRSKYFLSPVRNWMDARQYCKSKKADLVIINSQKEQEFIGTFFEGFQAWIGLTDQEKEGEWKWVDGTTLNTTFWWEGEPNNFNDEDCALTGSTFAKSNISSWNDHPCSHSLLGICELGIDL